MIRLSRRCAGTMVAICLGLTMPLLSGADVESVSLDGEVQTLKDTVLELDQELFLLEEELLFPANTQVAVFLSMNLGEFFALDSVQLELDGKDVTNYLYTEREVEALHRGGVQRLFLGNLKTGDHELIAIFTGWFISGELLKDELQWKTHNVWYRIWQFMLRYFAPIAIVFILLTSFDII